MAPVESTFMERTIPDTIVLFDVDGTLTPARNVSRLEMEMNVK
jgi:phosphomannomutase